MNTEHLLYEQRILALEKKLLLCTEALAQSKNENNDFIHIASHDLEAPLRKVSIFAERIRQKFEEGSSADMLPYIQKMLSAVGGMQSLIDSLSELSDVEAMPMEFIQCDLNVALAEILEEPGSVAGENKAQVTLSVLPVVEADPRQIKVVFKNLVNNAIKFTNKSIPPGIEITSGLLDEAEKAVFDLPPGKVFYKIEFADNGIGFRQEYADKILRPFQRLHGKAAYAGHGLGLAICKKIVERHLGIIYAKGKENSGARFVLILPETHN